MAYKVFYLQDRHGRQAVDIQTVLDTWTELGYVLHSITPRMVEGNTEGYVVVMDGSNAEK